MKKDTKPCPKCGQLIHKINGCDQMWCPGCKTPFSWRTGEIERGHVHNPEYYRWMRETGQNIGRDPLDERFDPCGNQVPTYQFILNKCRTYCQQVSDELNQENVMMNNIANQNNNQMWGGVSYRLDEGLILLAGMDISKDLRFGVGYDITAINPMGNSFEVMLGYNFKIKANKAISKYKNPRFL